MYSIFKLIKNDIIKYFPLIISIASACTLSQLIFHKICPFAIFAGIPCPGCGITRAFICLIKLQLKDAFFMNPCIFMWVPVIIILFINRYLLNSKLSPQTVNRLLIITGILSIITYLIRMFTMYPDTEPMTYYQNNILHFLISLCYS